MDTFLETPEVHLERETPVVHLEREMPVVHLDREKKKETVLVRWVQVRCWTLFLATQAVCLKK